MIQLDEVKQTYEENGYVILRNFFERRLIHDWEQSVAKIYALQAFKIQAIAQQLSSECAPERIKSVENLDEILLALEEHSRDAAYQCIFMANDTQAGLRMRSHDGLVKAVANLLNVREEFVLGAAIHPFINLPSSERLLYHWHQESSYYPKRTSFVNVWLPVWREKHEDNGTMWFCEKSHLGPTVQFSEYQGFDHTSLGKSGHFIQYEVLEEDTKDYEKVPVRAKPGDVVLFHPKMIHTSTLNNSKLPSYATVMRFWESSQDTSMHGTLAAKPYGRDFSLPGIRRYKWPQKRVCAAITADCS